MLGLAVISITKVAADTAMLVAFIAFVLHMSKHPPKPPM
jgi:hypothetical protein